MRIFKNVWVSDTDLKHELVNQVWQMKAPHVLITQFTAMYTHMQRLDVPASLTVTICVYMLGLCPPSNSPLFWNWRTRSLNSNAYPYHTHA